MKVLYKGHRYALEHLDGDGKSELQFVQRIPHHTPLEGVTNQEVIRALIDRVTFLDGEMPWGGNVEISQHLRMALVLHECRALMRKQEKGELLAETLLLGNDGHFLLK